MASGKAAGDSDFHVFIDSQNNTCWRWGLKGLMPELEPNLSLFLALEKTVIVHKYVIKCDPIGVSLLSHSCYWVDSRDRIFRLP